MNFCQFSVWYRCREEKDYIILRLYTCTMLMIGSFITFLVIPCYLVEINYFTFSASSYLAIPGEHNNVLVTLIHVGMVLCPQKYSLAYIDIIAFHITIV